MSNASNVLVGAVLEIGAPGEARQALPGGSFRALRQPNAGLRARTAERGGDVLLLSHAVGELSADVALPGGGGQTEAQRHRKLSLPGLARQGVRQIQAEAMPKDAPI